MNDAYEDYLAAPPRDDDHEIVVGNGAFAKVATEEGFPMSTPTMERYTAPSVNEGPKVLGYFGRKPTIIGASMMLPGSA